MTIRADNAPAGPRQGTVSYVLALVVLALFATVIARTPAFRQALTWDEWLTVENYTWAGVKETGDSRPIRRVRDFETLSAPTPRNLVIGLYSALGRWPEPNNHIVNSALINVALIVRRTSAMARTPALAGAMLFGLLMFHLCWSVLRWRAAAFPVLILALGWPYTMAFSTLARGYTLALALQALWFVLAVRASRRPTSIAIGAAMAASAVASLVNVVSSAIMWIVPAYVAVLFVRPVVSNDSCRAWLRNWVIQVLAIGTAAVIFLVDRLPALYSSTQQYGVAATSVSARLDGIRQLMLSLFPSAEWAVVGTIAIVGLIVASRQADMQWATALAGAVIATDLLYYSLASRLPYERTMFQLIPLVLLGIATSVMTVVRFSRISVVWAGVFSGLASMVVVLAAQPGVACDLCQEQAFIDQLALLPAARERLTYPIFAPGIDVPFIAHQTPADWLDEDSRIPGVGEIQLAIFSRRVGGDWLVRASAGQGKNSRWDASAWIDPNGRELFERGDYRVLLIGGRMYEWSAPGDRGPRRVTFWYPDPDRVNVSDSIATDMVESAGLRYFVVKKRRTIKVNVYSTIYSIAIVTETPEELATVERATQHALANFGGSAMVFVATAQ